MAPLTGRLAAREELVPAAARRSRAFKIGIVVVGDELVAVVAVHSRFRLAIMAHPHADAVTVHWLACMARICAWRSCRLIGTGVAVGGRGAPHEQAGFRLGRTSRQGHDGERM